MILLYILSLHFLKKTKNDWVVRWNLLSLYLTPDSTSVFARKPNISKRDSEIRSYELVRLKGCQAFECYWSTDHFKVEKFGPLCIPKGINSLILSGMLIPTVIKSVSSEHLARAHQTLCCYGQEAVTIRQSTISSAAAWMAMSQRHWEILFVFELLASHHCTISSIWVLILV